MRAAVLAVVCLVTLLAIVPGANAQPEPPQCVYGGLSVTVGPVTVSTSCGEGPRVDVDADCIRDGTC